jgi:hypothetical protein
VHDDWAARIPHLSRYTRSVTAYADEPSAGTA